MARRGTPASAYHLGRLLPPSRIEPNPRRPSGEKADCVRRGSAVANLQVRSSWRRGYRGANLKR